MVKGNYMQSIVILLTTLVLICIGAKLNSTCQNQAESPVIERHFYHHMHGTNYYAEHNVTISKSPYFAQRLINELVKQLLSTKLGYDSVRYSEEGLPYTPITNCSNNHTFDGSAHNVSNHSSATVEGEFRDSCVTLDLPPEPMLTVQTSKEPVDVHYTDVGSLGIATRYGFYMSSSVASQAGDASNSMASSDSCMRNAIVHVLSKFTDYNKQTIQKYAEYKRCTAGMECPNITYLAPNCSNESCAILLVGDTDFSMEELQENINSSSLPLMLLPVGEHLTSLVMNLSSSGVPVIFFSRSHELLTFDNAFVRVRTFNCGVFENDYQYPITELRKLMWSRLIKLEPVMYNFLKRIRLSEIQVLSMLKEYNDKYNGLVTTSTIENYIHDWISKNSAIVCEWMPHDVGEKPKLYIGGFFPLWSEAVWKEPSLVPAARMAIKLINDDPNVLKDYQLELIVNDTRCDASDVLNIFTEYLVDDTIWSRMVGGLGPACSDTALSLAALATHYNYVIISYAVKAIVLSLDRSRYKYFFRTVPQINDYSHVYVALFKKLDLRNPKVSMLTDDSSGEFPVYHRIMAEVFRSKGITLATQDLLPRQQYLTDDADESYGEYLDGIKEADSRIIIMDVYVGVARKIMCLAYIKKMTLDYGYNWFLPDLYFWDWYDPTPGITCSKEEMKEAVRGYFTLAHANYDKTSAVAVGGMNGTDFWKNKYSTAVTNDENSKHPSEYGPYCYDAVWAFTRALELLYAENPAYLKYIHTEHATKRYVENIYNTKFQGVSGSISFNEEGDRSGITEIKQYITILEQDGYYKSTTVGNWSNGNLSLNADKIKWGSVGPTTTTIQPAFRSEKVNCDWDKLAKFLDLTCSSALLVVVLPTCCLFVLIIVVAALTALRKAKRRYKLAADWASKFSHGRGFLNLDEKEIPRDHVVLNRKLGEGAFGTVYGGEAYINLSWIGVAVKTLKAGSNSEDRLDFLREADIMKRFDHKNIAKLLGVTTRGEPAYAIMEFMLYGDLRTYLLSRRELVGLNTKEAEDVLASSLTRMAMDIAEGLHYLHSKEYIHRDIACRNCLVSASRNVKIGDFGMTRRVYDDGSYIFTRRGKLPVRWMAPESFIDGIFTYKTDIWSFGVLLYEIVTFGSTPYQMLANGEVFEKVKSGGVLTLPEECTDELKSLMLACWHKDPTRRPNAADIYVLLADNENMIHPLLACPVYAEIRDCDTLELELDMALAPLKPSAILKRPFLRQSSSVISVDTGMSTLSRHRNHSEISYKRSASSNRRRSSHSIIDLFSLVHPSVATPLSMPSPSHSTEQNTSFQFTSDSRHMCEENSVYCEGKLITTCAETRRQHHSGSLSTGQQVRTENDYLLTTRSCSEIDDASYNSHTPLVHSTEETVI